MSICPSCGRELTGHTLRQALAEEPVRGRRGPVRELRRCQSCQRLASRAIDSRKGWDDAGMDPGFDHFFDDEPLPLPEPWILLPTAEAKAALKAQMHVEVSNGHPLFGKQITAIARCGRCDEVLFSVEEDSVRFAQVHLTWRQGPETPPWPSTDYLSLPLSDSLLDHTHGSRGLDESDST